MTQVTPLLTPSQAVERLAAAGIRVTTRTLRNWASAGRLPYVELPSGQSRYSVEDIDALVRRRGTRSAA